MVCVKRGIFMIKLILASKSKWRREIIEMAGLKCETIVSDVEENIEFK